MIHPTGRRVGGRIYGDLGVDDLEGALKAVSDYFDPAWLAANPGHPLGELWLLKDDFLATNELFWLGEAINRLAPINDRWVREAVEHIKSEDRGRRIGYTFELLALASIVVNCQDVRPAGHGTKTFDGDATLTDGHDYKVSIKNFAASDRDRRFQRNAKAFEALVTAEAERRGKNWVGMMVAAEGYPRDRDWETLKAALPELIAQEEPQDDGFWTVRFQNNRPKLNNELDTENVSYSILIASRFHQNEVTGYINKVIRACTDVDDAAATLGTDERCIALIRISENAPINAITEELQRFINEERRRMFGALIYQSAVTTNDDKTGLHHNMKPVIRAGQIGMDITYQVPVGRVSEKPSRQVIKIDGKELSADGYHLYSRRKIFEPFNMTEKGCELNFGAQPGSDHIAVMIWPDGQRLPWSMGHGDHTEIILFS